MITSTAGLEQHQPALRESHRLWSLWDLMINYQIFGFCRLLDHLSSIQSEFELRIGFVDSQIKFGGGYQGVVESGMPYEVSAVDIEKITKLLGFAEQQANLLQLKSVNDRIDLFRIRLRGPVSIHDFLSEVRTLRETIHKGLDFQYFYRYPTDKADLILKVDHEWAPVFAKFVSLKSDVVAAVDCHALGHYTAAVFYLMRVMENAVQAFGKKLGVNLIKKNPGKRVSELNWENILNDLNPKLKALPQNTVRQKRRYEKYSATQSYLYGVKDAWRNPTMHPRSEGYNEPQARDIINHVRSFLTQFTELF